MYKPCKIEMGLNTTLEVNALKIYLQKTQQSVSVGNSRVIASESLKKLCHLFACLSEPQLMVREHFQLLQQRPPPSTTREKNTANGGEWVQCGKHLHFGQRKILDNADILSGFCWMFFFSFYCKQDGDTK